MIKLNMVRDRLTLIQDAVAVLEDIGRLPPDQFVGDVRNPAAAESYLRRALEAVFDVGRHLLAAGGQISLASEYKSIARGLGDRGIVPAQLADRLQMMAGYRNRLVHLYAQVTPQELQGIIQDNLSDLKDFVRSIDTWLGLQPKV